VEFSTVQYSTVQYSIAHYGKVQYSTAQYGTVQYSAAQYSTVQYSTVHHPLRYSWQILTELKFFWQIFEKYSNTKFHRNPSWGSRVFSCGRTWQSKYCFFEIVRMRLNTPQLRMLSASHFYWHTSFRQPILNVAPRSTISARQSVIKCTHATAQSVQWPSYGMDHQEIPVQIPAAARHFSLLQMVQNGSGAQPASYSKATGRISFLKEWLSSRVREVDHWPPFSAKILAIRHTSTPPYAFTTLTGANSITHLLICTQINVQTPFLGKRKKRSRTQ